MSGYIVLSVVFYIIVSALFMIVAMDWMEDKNLLPERRAKIAGLMLASTFLWPIFSIVMALYIIVNES